jgi:hypothetical protein
MTDLTINPTAQDSQNLIRETLRMSTALRQSTLTPRKRGISFTGDLMKKLSLTEKSHVIDHHINPTKKDLSITKMK